MPQLSITPQLIPHARFHTGSWLRPSSRPAWYYFLEKKNNNTIINKKFMRSVDKPLRKLVRLLHANGIKTTPSCSGHSMPKKYFKKLYAALERDRKKIKGNGLKLKDIESGKKYFFRDAQYALPWSRKAFIKKISRYQHNGVIGIRPGRRKKLKAELLRLKLPGVKISISGPVVLFTINGKQRGENSLAWKNVTRHISRVVKNTSGK